MWKFFRQEFPGFGIAGVEIVGENLAVDYLRAPLIGFQGRMEIPIADIRTMVFWEVERITYTELTCRVEWSGGEFVFAELVRGFRKVLSALEDRYDQPDVANRAWRGEVVRMIENGQPRGRVF